MSWSFLPFAHALASRQDLPIPAWLFAWGASIVLIVSFFALSVAWRAPRFEEEGWRPLGAGLSRVLLSLPAQILYGVIGVFLLGVAVYAGLRGTEAPDRNFALTFIFVTCWLGFPFLSVVFGDVFRPFNPWRAVGRAVGGDVLGDRGPAAGPPPLPRTGRALAGRDRADGLRLARGHLRRQRRRRRRPQPARDRGRDPRLLRLHPGDDGAVRGRGVVRTRRDLLGLLRDALPARLVRRQGRPARSEEAILGRRPLGDDPGIGGGRDRLDRQHDLRRRPGGGVQGWDRMALRTPLRHRRSTASPGSGSPTRSSWPSPSAGSASST